MWEGYKVIDGDAHMQGAMDIWDRFMPKEYYDRRPKVVDWEDKMFFHYAPGEFFPQGTWRGGKGLGRRLSPPKLTGSTVSSMVRAETPAVSSSSTVRITLSALP